jgi:hypothetical protein
VDTYVDVVVIATIAIILFVFVVGSVLYELAKRDEP